MTEQREDDFDRILGDCIRATDRYMEETRRSKQILESGLRKAHTLQASSQSLKDASDRIEQMNREVAAIEREIEGYQKLAKYYESLEPMDSQLGELRAALLADNSKLLERKNSLDQQIKFGRVCMEREEFATAAELHHLLQIA